jgi:sialic acid synthase SpsE
MAAVALGATVIEKHLVLDRSRQGPDTEISVTPAELAQLRGSLDKIARQLGDGVKVPRPGELEVTQIARRSLFAASDIKKGELITPDLLTCHRPGTGIPASQYSEVMGQRAAQDIEADEMILWDMLEGA